MILHDGGDIIVMFDRLFGGIFLRFLAMAVESNYGHYTQCRVHSNVDFVYHDVTDQQYLDVHCFIHHFH